MMWKKKLIFSVLILIITITVILFYNFSSNKDFILNFKIEVVVSNLDTPWSLVFDEKGRLFFTERPGYVKVYENGKVIKLNVQDLKVKEIGEGGLLGLALDPNFTKNNFVYIYYTYEEDGKIFNRVVRYDFKNYSLINSKILIDKIPGAYIHNGGRIKFGPDNKLYITTGDAAIPELSQNIDSLAGKILRINPDGKVPKDNPFNNLIYSYGHRNPQGLAWNPINKLLYSSEHGPIGHDEINLIIKGKNYGWPEVKGISGNEKFIDPIIESGLSTWAPAGIAFYTGDKFPELKNSLLVANLRGEHLKIVEIDENDPWKVKRTYEILKGELGRIRDVTVGPDGYIYLATSNKDGRGFPRENDDKIIKLIPIEETKLITTPKELTVIKNETKKEEINENNFFFLQIILIILISLFIIFILIKKFRK